MRQLGTHQLGGFTISVVALSEEPGAEEYIAYAERPDEDHFIGRRGASREAVLLAIGYDVGRLEAEAALSGPRDRAPQEALLEDDAVPDLKAELQRRRDLNMTDRKCAHCRHPRSQHTGKGPRGDLFHGCSVWTCNCPHFGDPTPLSEVGM